jgi:tRNA threonylcarbamoyl adenosine modification protein YjeE
MNIFNESELLAFADHFSTTLPNAGVIAVWGDLGAGKTTFIRRVIQTYAGDANLIVPSPTFTLIQEYILPRGTLWHCDLYRLTAAEECLELGLQEAAFSHICFIEWPDRMGALLPHNRIDIHINVVDDNYREVALTKNQYLCP